MTDPSLALDKAILAALRADGPIGELCASRVFDVVPESPVPAFPYLDMGDAQIVPDAAEGLDRSVEIYATVHAWSRKIGRPQIKKVAGAVVDALDGIDLNLGSDLTLVLIRFGGTRYISDPDGETSHAVVTFRALVDQA